MPFDGVPQGIVNPPGEPTASDSPENAKAPGTMILVFVFLAAFVVYYFVNWKLLSFLWKVG